MRLTYKGTTMSSAQRIAVWNGERAQTTGGLKKADLMRNRHGRIVSKKKSGQAFAQNNLGSFLREKGKKVEKSDMLRKKGKPPKDKPSPKKAPPKKAAVKPKAKAAAKPPKPAAAKVQAPAKPKPKPKKPKAAAKKKSKSKINPLTQQPYAKKGIEGFVPKVHADNILSKKRKEKAKAPKASAQEIKSAWEALLY